ncbi:hypothetical protein BXY39_3747 [Eilatimonas milleporae]|uniref:Uncharacterized protein n=2 Tax=Eilatimonas milleporae TaxID=911205 RepID=A0A3M0BWH6_9PROT|nr:hypothetical protein BXY39_3747 [Eilatimonas milleporae]
MTTDGDHGFGVNRLGKRKKVSAVQRVVLAVLTLFMTACDPATRLPAEPTAQIGTRALIKRHGQELVAEVTRVRGKLVTTEFNWRGEQVAKRRYYRGLYPISGTEYGYQFELDFDDSLLEQIFPLRVGNHASFDGNLKIIDRGTAVDVLVDMVVVAEKTIDLSESAHRVFVVEIETEYRSAAGVKRKNNTVYYAPDLSMVLKSVMHEEGQQTFWRVISVERPGAGGKVKSPTLRQRRSGTVMI